MSYKAPVTEQRFVLDHVVGIADLAAHPRFASATADMVDAVLEGAAAFAEGEYAPLNRIGDTMGSRFADGVVSTPKGFREAYHRFVEGGWATLSVPEEHGGQGLPFVLATVVMEDLGTANMGFSLVNMLNAGAVEALVHHADDRQRETWLPKLVTGEWTGTMNLTEPAAGSDVGALRTQAVPAGDGGWHLTGTKIFITYGEHDLADNIVHLVLARTPGGAAGTKGISLFLVPKFLEDGTRNGVRCLSIEHKLGIHASPTCVMGFGEGGDAKGWLVGPEGAGMRAMFTMMNHARLNVGLQGVQIGERATQGAIDHARSRVQSARDGKPVAIIEHPDVRRMLMRMRALTMGARALVYIAAGSLDRATVGEEGAKARADLLTPLAKAWGTDVGVEVASLGVQVQGGMGFVEETGAAQHYRDARIAPIYEGTNGIQAADLVGRKLMGDGGAAFHALIAEMRAEIAGEETVERLVYTVDSIGRWMLEAAPDDRLAGSYPFLTMTSVAVAGWMMVRQSRIATAMLDAGEGDPAFLKAKVAVARFFVERIVPEAGGLEAAARGGADLLYALDGDGLAA